MITKSIPMVLADKKKQHYVPKAYMKHFAWEKCLEKMENDWSCIF